MSVCLEEVLTMHVVPLIFAALYFAGVVYLSVKRRPLSSIAIALCGAIGLLVMGVTP